MTRMRTRELLELALYALAGSVGLTLIAYAVRWARADWIDAHLEMDRR